MTDGGREEEEKGGPPKVYKRRPSDPFVIRKEGERTDGGSEHDLLLPTPTPTPLPPARPPAERR
uniref:Uncharacterized protein n=1 Tax=Panulirus argus virus 1 TaxID=380624 RepID=A0A6G9HDM4_9VIRU|nr:hypothetical protein [Panulirus argus virus 1]